MMKIEHDITARTAGLTSGAAVEALGNRYDLVLVAAQRARELRRGHAPKIATKYGPIVTSILEIEAGTVGTDYLLKVTSDTDSRRKKQMYHNR